MCNLASRFSSSQGSIKSAHLHSLPSLFIVRVHKLDIHENVLSNIRPVSPQDSSGVILRVCDTYQNFASSEITL